MRIASMNYHGTRAFPENAALHCHAAASAAQGNQLDAAAASYEEALRLDPMVWEAFEGLCGLGMQSLACFT